MSSARLGGSIEIAGKTVSRLGFGTMRLTGPGTWGDPDDRDRALAVLRQAVHTHGITHVDTADAYGPHTVENLIKDALYPYPDGLLIATKVGFARPAPSVWAPHGHPVYLRSCVEASLRRLNAASIAPASVQPALDDLLRTTGADNVTQLVVQGHAWGLLGAERADFAWSGASR
ncbi:aldo/keto reductase [Streptomyces sp. CFMR 7]|uniref:aldo/keto reductase n=1 Tax=Streptomyces sp. CFMR 7 TaxID=1649184 RepID=UPI0021B53AB3|nr:aldo/keto reductase [Streptomyces sp. CFMR 7]